MLHIRRQGVLLGKFVESVVASGLENGIFFPTDIAWRSDFTDWLPLSEAIQRPAVQKAISHIAEVPDHTSYQHLLRETRLMRVQNLGKTETQMGRLSLAELDHLAKEAELINEAVVITNASGEILWTNSGFTRLCQYTLPEVQGKKPGSFLQGKDTDPITVQLMRESILKAQPCNYEILNYRKDGEPYWASLFLGPLFSESKVSGFLAIINDITKVKLRELKATSSSVG